MNPYLVRIRSMLGKEIRGHFIPLALAVAGDTWASGGGGEKYQTS